MGSIAFIGAGRLGVALATALSQHGCPVQAIASRRAASAEALAHALPGCRSVRPEEAVMADLVFLTVPDDEIAATAARLPWRAGQQVVHCSGATEVSALEAAARRGALTGGFHPLQIFSDPQRALGLIAGSSVAIEGPPALEARLRELAERLGMHPLHLPPGARALYHAGASFAASFLLSMLQEALDAWRSFGIDEPAALQALLPLARGTLDMAEARGLPGALAGPVSRGDAGVVGRHLAAMAGLGSAHAAFYREFGLRQLQLAQQSGRLSEAQLEALRRVMAAG
jgi:predicted short-subunit dehydrogenase-like oxidoreductase (DUF2520 family)